MVFSWLFRGPRFGQHLRVLALEQSSEQRTSHRRVFILPYFYHSIILRFSDLCCSSRPCTCLWVPAACTSARHSTRTRILASHVSKCRSVAYLCACHREDSMVRERKMHTKRFWHKFCEHPRGSGTSRPNSRNIPDSSLRSPRKTNFRGRARTFRPPPLRVEDPHPTGQSPDPKS